MEIITKEDVADVISLPLKIKIGISNDTVLGSYHAYYISEFEKLDFIHEINYFVDKFNKKYALYNKENKEYYNIFIDFVFDGEVNRKLSTICKLSDTDTLNYIKKFLWDFKNSLNTKETYRACIDSNFMEFESLDDFKLLINDLDNYKLLKVNGCDELGETFIKSQIKSKFGDFIIDFIDEDAFYRVGEYLSDKYLKGCMTEYGYLYKISSKNKNMF